MQFDEAVRSRRSIRQFEPREVPDSVVTELLDLARYAPSSMNGQPWHFVLVRSPETRSRLAEIKNDFCPPAKRAFRADFIARAPLIVVVCVEEESSYDRGLENGIIATTHILLAARDRGLGAVYMSAYDFNEPGLATAIAELLNLPAGVSPVTLIPMGYPSETPAARDRRPLARMVHRERF